MNIKLISDIVIISQKKGTSKMFKRVSLTASYIIGHFPNF